MEKKKILKQSTEIKNLENKHIIEGSTNPRVFSEGLTTWQTLVRLIKGNTLHITTHTHTHNNIRIEKWNIIKDPSDIKMKNKKAYEACLNF